MRKLTPILLATIVFSLLSPVLEVQALLPTFLYYNISVTAPDISQEVAITIELDFITDEGEDISSLVGPLTVQLLWTRDKVSWVTDSMSLIAGNNIYRAIIPRQDGYANSRYDFGSGPCYWYVKIENNMGESDTFFSQSDPNDEIYFLDYGAGETVVIGETEPTPALPDLGKAFDQLLTDVFGANPLDDPYVRIILLIMVAVVVLIIATRGIGGERFNRFIGRLFRK